MLLILNLNAISIITKVPKTPATTGELSWCKIFQFPLQFKLIHKLAVHTNFEDEPI